MAGAGVQHGHRVAAVVGDPRVRAGQGDRPRVLEAVAGARVDVHRAGPDHAMPGRSGRTGGEEDDRSHHHHHGGCCRGPGQRLIATAGARRGGRREPARIGPWRRLPAGSRSAWGRRGEGWLPGREASGRVARRAGRGIARRRAARDHRVLSRGRRLRAGLGNQGGVDAECDRELAHHPVARLRRERSALGERRRRQPDRGLGVQALRKVVVQHPGQVGLRRAHQHARLSRRIRQQILQHVRHHLRPRQHFGAKPGVADDHLERAARLAVYVPRTARHLRAPSCGTRQMADVIVGEDKPVLHQPIDSLLK